MFQQQLNITYNLTKTNEKLPTKVSSYKLQNVSNVNKYAKEKLELQQLTSTLQFQDQLSLDL